MRPLASCVALATILAIGAPHARATDHAALIEATPCLLEYRTWFFTFRRSESFPIPAAFTPAQCSYAASIHEQIQEAQQRAAQVQRDANAERAAAEKQRKDQAARQAAARQAAEKRAADKEAASKEQAERDAVARRPGVRIGMTAHQVLNESHWGRPDSIRRTTTVHGTTEQWSYGSSQYLYFRDGILEAIQN